MIIWQGKLEKMPVEYNTPVRYYLESIRLIFSNEIRCLDCDKKTNKSFGQGFCYTCFLKSPQNSECIVRPELCKAHERQGRDVQWEEKNHNVPHYVYLAQTSDVKVGVTRASNLHNRWIDQGARRALKLALVPYRQLAGLIEIELKNHISDKTNWQKMLKDERGEEVDLVKLKNSLIDLLPEDLMEYADDDDKIVEIQYPVQSYLDKIKSVGFDKETVVEGKLQGIRGQYLMFSNGNVINLRKHSGYIISVEVVEVEAEKVVVQGSLF